MKKISILTLLASCSTIGFHAASLEASGDAYLESRQLSLMSPCYLVRDLTDEEMDDADNLPGGGYSDSKWPAENPPMNEDEDGNPTYAAQHVFEDDDGNIFILEDDGEITEVPA